MGKHPLPGYGSVAHGNRLVRTRMLGGVGAGGEIPPATRLCIVIYQEDVFTVRNLDRFMCCNETLPSCEIDPLNIRKASFR